jgi:hypothetical protein
MRDLARMAEYLVWAMEGRGQLPMDEIYRAVKAKCDERDRPLPTNWKSVIRQTLQAYCSSRPQYRRRDDWFVFHKRGWWSCKTTSATVDDLL